MTDSALVKLLAAITAAEAGEVVDIVALRASLTAAADQTKALMRQIPELVVDPVSPFLPVVDVLEWRGAAAAKTAIVDAFHGFGRTEPTDERGMT